MPVLDARAHLRDVERLLGNQHDVGSTGDARVGRDPPGVPTHHLDHHDPVVTLRRGVQTVDRIGRDLHGGLEPEREVGGREIVVDRLGYPDHCHVRALGRRPGQLDCHTERVLPADDDQRVDPLAGQGLEQPPDPVVGLVRVRP